MKLWLSLLKLEWLTGEDGRIAFYKLATIVHTQIFLAYAVGLFVEGQLGERMLWSVLWVAMLLGSVFGLKGLRMAFLTIASAVGLKAEIKGSLVDVVKEIRGKKDDPST